MTTENALHLFAKIVSNKICGHSRHVDELLEYDTISGNQIELLREISQLFHTEDCYFTYYTEDMLFNIGIKTRKPFNPEIFNRDFDGYYYQYWQMNSRGQVI